MERVLKQEEVYVAVDLEYEGGEHTKPTAVFPAVGFLHPVHQSLWGRFAAFMLRLRLVVLNYFRPAEDNDGGNMKVCTTQDDGSHSIFSN